ncbi:hypothetical protein [Streptomyces sp. NBC_00459]|uniref:hypothetical protein n=1 Tax=Streptomyces sp. NBC_00459 TaxID=2975749 RepID=UPI002E16EF50
MTLTVEDRLTVTELIAPHGHLVDEGHLDRTAEVFTTPRDWAPWRTAPAAR